ncbi:neurotransmitter:Na+ symporter, NSS family, partial [Geosporobacter subterraneus DSM 17957]
VIGGFFAGVPSAYSLNINDNQDWVWGVGLLLSGLFVAIALMKHGLEKVRNNDINTPWSDYKIGKWWSVCVALFPVFTVVIIGWWIWQAITWYPGNWWDPTEIFSVGTIIVQFAILIGISLLTNNWLANKIGQGHDIMESALEEIRGSK